MGVLLELPIQAMKSVVGQDEGANVVLQAIRQLSETLPGAVYLSVAAAAGAVGGANSQAPKQQTRQKHKFQ